MAGTAGDRRERGLAVFVVALVGLIAALAGLIVLATGLSSEIDQRTTELRELRLVEARSSLARVHADEVYAREAHALGLVDSSELLAAARARESVLTPGLSELRSLAEVDDAVGRQARRLLDVYGNEAAAVDPDIYDLYAASQIFQWEGTPVPSITPQMGAIADAAWLDDAATLTRHEVIVALFARSGAAVTDDVTSFLTDEADYIAEQPGGYVGDGPTPLRDSWIPVDRIGANEPELLTAANRLLEGSVVVEMNRWLEGWAEGPLPDPPVDERTFLGDATELAGSIRAIADLRLTERRSDVADSLDAATSQRRVFTLLAAASALAVLLMLAFVVRRASVGAARLQERANTDPLTGIGNRNVLSDMTARYLEAPHLAHHVVVTIDMDCFKVANDTFGHAVGDRMLVSLATGLRSLAHTFAGESTVVRLGGDEFFLSFHSEGPIDSVALRGQLDALRATSISTDAGPRVDIEFSYGLVEALGSPSLSELLDASDLAAYEQKALRRVARTVSSSGVEAHDSAA